MFDTFLIFVLLQRNSLERTTIQVSRSHTVRHAQLAGLLWMSDQLLGEPAICTTQIKHEKITSMPLAEFEPAIPEIKRPPTNSLDRTATGIGLSSSYLYVNRLSIIRYVHHKFQFVLQNVTTNEAIQFVKAINLLATDFFFQILAHPVFKMWVLQKPNKVALRNKRHFEEKKMEIIQHV